MGPLAAKQARFVAFLALLIRHAVDQGWKLTLGDGLRRDRKGHMQNSLHYIGLAQDLNLFVDGVWQQHDCPEWQALGAFWKALSSDLRWGGDFTSVDLNHFSIEEGGRA